MNVNCPNCATIYRVDPAKVPEAGVRARCAVCAAIFPVHREGASPSAPLPVAAAAAPPEAPAPAAVPVPAPAAPAAPPPPPPQAEAAIAPALPQPDLPQPPEASRPPAIAPAEPARPGRPMPPRPAMPPGSLGGAMAGRPAPAMPPRPAAPPAAAPAAAAGPRRPVNPFLSQDPSQKARRLARALISDMVVYHPAKRREGIRDGTLKQLFEEEIKKSWEEYSEQVGRDVAESSNHFRDALNEILADGRQIF